MLITRQFQGGSDPVDILRIPLVPVVTVLIGYIQNDVNTAKRSERQTKNIDEAVGLIL
jgi:hypothetical protein